MSRRQATSFSLIGGATAQSTMWESWKNARMGRSTPWRATLGMPANSRAIQSGAAQYTVTDALPIDGRMGERKTRGQSSGCSFALHIPCAVPAMIVSSISSKVSRSTSNRRRKVVFPVGASGCMYWSTDMWNIVTS